MQPDKRHDQSKPQWSQGIGHSFFCAFTGIAILLRTQRNARLHAAATALVIIAGVALNITRTDWCWLVLAISSVLTAEAFNTALEALADRITTEQDEAIRIAKDLAAGAVLLATFGACVIGLLVLGPPLWEQLAAR
jgi:diacylglycerol kinase